MRNDITKQLNNDQSVVLYRIVLECCILVSKVFLFISLFVCLRAIGYKALNGRVIG